MGILIVILIFLVVLLLIAINVLFYVLAIKESKKKVTKCPKCGRYLLKNTDRYCRECGEIIPKEYDEGKFALYLILAIVLTIINAFIIFYALCFFFIAFVFSALV